MVGVRTNLLSERETTTTKAEIVTFNSNVKLKIIGQISLPLCIFSFVVLRKR